MGKMNIKKKLLSRPIKLIFLIVILVLSLSIFCQLTPKLLGDAIAKKALVAISSNGNKTIEHITVKFSNSIFESWHDSANNIWRSEYKDVNGNTDNITIVKGNQATQLSPKEKNVSVTTLSDELAKENEDLYNKPQFDLLKIDLNQEGWKRLANQKINNSSVYVIEHKLDQALDKKVDGKIEKFPGILRLYIDPSTFLIVKQEKMDLNKTVVESNDWSYEMVFSNENLFNTDIPDGYKVQHVNQPSEYKKDIQK